MSRAGAAIAGAGESADARAGAERGAGAGANASARADVGARKVRSRAEQRAFEARVHRWTRFAIQIAFFLLVPGLFSVAFSGVKYIFTQIGALQAIEPTSFVLALVGTLGFTILFGRFFCGYACAFGTVGDILYAAVDFLRSKMRIPSLRIPDRLLSALSLVKYVVLAAICVMCLVGVWSDISGYSPWVAFAGFTGGSFDGIAMLAFVLLALCLVGMALHERFFCQVLCPMGAVFSLMPVIGASRFTRTQAHCAKNCGKCHDACPVGIWPDEGLRQGECISCGRCADACPMANVNLVALERAARGKRAAGAAASVAKSGSAAREIASGSPSVATMAKPSLPMPKPLLKTREKWRLLRGTGTGVVLLKSALLLALCWAVGATRYLPTFSEVFPQAPWLF